MVNKPLIRPYFPGGTLGGVGWLATTLGQGNGDDEVTTGVMGTYKYCTKKMPKFNSSPLKKSGWKTILSYWEGNFSGDMLNFGGVDKIIVPILDHFGMIKNPSSSTNIPAVQLPSLKLTVRPSK